MTRIFATPAQWATYRGDDAPPADADRILRSASIEVARLVMNAHFDLDNSTPPMPSDPEIVQALQDATCAQADYFLETGDLTGASGQFQTLALGSFSVSRNTPGGAQGTTGVDGSRTAAEAISILQQAGLIRAVGTPW